MKLCLMMKSMGSSLKKKGRFWNFQIKQFKEIVYIYLYTNALNTVCRFYFFILLSI
jgi:hypothetical protein